MPIDPINLTSLVATILGISIVLIPVIGITARFALKPTVDAFSRFFEAKGMEETLHIMERRMALQQEQIESLQHTVHRLSETSDFDRALEAGPPSPAGES